MENFLKNFKLFFSNIFTKLEESIHILSNFHKNYISDEQSSSIYSNIPFDNADYKKIIVYVSGEKNIKYINGFTSQT